jgi:hypothetical protein
MTTREDPQGCDQDRLWALAVGALGDEEARVVEAHLPGCAECRAHVEVIRADVDALGYPGGQGGPEALAEKVLDRARALEARARRLRWLALSLLLVAALAGGVWGAHRLGVAAQARRDVWALEHAIQRVQNAEGRYPADERALVDALGRLHDPGVRVDAQGRPLDHWGHPFHYRCPGVRVKGMFDLWSDGADGVDGEGAPDDQTNWR